MNTNEIPREPTTIKQTVMYQMRDASAELNQLSRELEEHGEYDGNALIRIVRRLAAASSAAEIGIEAKVGSSDADLAREIIRNPHRMKGTVIP
jgi:hypothetical protein